MPIDSSENEDDFGLPDRYFSSKNSFSRVAYVPLPYLGWGRYPPPKNAKHIKHSYSIHQKCILCFQKHIKYVIAGQSKSCEFPEELPIPGEVSANVTLASSYIWRGEVQNGNNPAIQGGFDYGGTGCRIRSGMTVIWV